ncbi:MAG: carboxypeptidase-like regulatory domain-containing protein, partial [Bacteroidales bacterium]|nr:carboxypeptidase-like regulatory domain-containing protein [Bacteroidales bacterium]
MGKLFSAIWGLLLVAVLPSAALAQTVAGSAVDAQSGEPLLFANVVLVKAADTTQVTGTSSDAEGRFVFKKMAPGRYFIQISTLGYHLANSVAFDINGKADSVSLPPVLLTPTSLQLQEVEVRAKRPMVEMKPGKIVMNVAEHLASTTAENAYEMLKKFPGVTIDNNDNISLNGKAGVLVMVDGRNTYLGGKDLVNYLKALPARSVTSIEAIANPSSKYDAEG